MELCQISQRVGWFQLPLVDGSRSHFLFLTLQQWKPFRSTQHVPYLPFPDRMISDQNLGYKGGYTTQFLGTILNHYKNPY